ncbi:DUF721 domain-containing protein [Nocardioides aequoreus]|uniref:DUF721 domain-containing protein n=1 Tax=Nocardioides aequoreus TaxID=397278 RepID=UPI0004C44D9A|nr:DciA family protein [Nocardioides aequoreus]
MGEEEPRGRPAVEPVETPDESHDEPHDEAGLDLAKQVARGLAGRTGERRRRPGRQLSARRTEGQGATADDREPQPLDDSLGRLVSDQGWETELRVHGVFARWEGIVGREVGQHVRPESFADGRLTCRTESTAWATQMRLLAPDIVRRLNEVLGDGTVEVIDVRGPRSPSWTRGRLRVKGRGPRDTYG